MAVTDAGRSAITGGGDKWSHGQRIVESARRALASSSRRFLRCVDCRYRDGVLTLDGRVPTYYLKQLAQTHVARIDGVSEIENRIVVTSAIGRVA